MSSLSPHRPASQSRSSNSVKRPKDGTTLHSPHERTSSNNQGGRTKQPRISILQPAVPIGIKTYTDKELLGLIPDGRKGFRVAKSGFLNEFMQTEGQRTERSRGPAPALPGVDNETKATPRSKLPRSSYVIEKTAVPSSDSADYEQIWDESDGGWKRIVFPARNPNSRAQVCMLEAWMSSALAKAWSEHGDKQTNNTDSSSGQNNVVRSQLLFDAQMKILVQGLGEIERQVSHHCQIRGQLLHKIWLSLNDLFEFVLLEMRSALTACDKRLLAASEILEEEKHQKEATASLHAEEMKAAVDTLTAKWSKMVREIKAVSLSHEAKARANQEDAATVRAWLPRFDMYKNSALSTLLPSTKTTVSPTSGASAQEMLSADLTRLRECGLLESWFRLGNNYGNDTGALLEGSDSDDFGESETRRRTSSAAATGAAARANRQSTAVDWEERIQFLMESNNETKEQLRASKLELAALQQAHEKTIQQLKNKENQLQKAKWELLHLLECATREPMIIDDTPRISITDTPRLSRDISGAHTTTGGSTDASQASGKFPGLLYQIGTPSIQQLIAYVKIKPAMNIALMHRDFVHAIKDGITSATHLLFRLEKASTAMPLLSIVGSLRVSIEEWLYDYALQRCNQAPAAALYLRHFLSSLVFWSPTHATRAQGGSSLHPRHISNSESVLLDQMKAILNMDKGDPQLNISPIEQKLWVVLFSKMVNYISTHSPTHRGVVPPDLVPVQEALSIVRDILLPLPDAPGGKVEVEDDLESAERWVVQNSTANINMAPEEGETNNRNESNSKYSEKIQSTAMLKKASPFQVLHASSVEQGLEQLQTSANVHGGSHVEVWVVMDLAIRECYRTAAGKLSAAIESLLKVVDLQGSWVLDFASVTVFAHIACPGIPMPTVRTLCRRAASYGNSEISLAGLQHAISDLSIPCQGLRPLVCTPPADLGQQCLYMKDSVINDAKRLLANAKSLPEMERQGTDVKSLEARLSQVQSFFSGNEHSSKIWCALSLLTAELELIGACGSLVRAVQSQAAGRLCHRLTAKRSISAWKVAHNTGLLALPDAEEAQESEGA